MSLLLAVTSGGGVNYALSGAAGSYVITGQPAALKVGRNLAGAAGAYVITGQPGTLTYTPGSGTIAYSLLGDAGSYLITGQPATLSYSPATPVAPPASSSMGGGGGGWVPKAKVIYEKSPYEERLKKKRDKALEKVLQNAYDMAQDASDEDEEMMVMAMFL